MVENGVRVGFGLTSVVLGVDPGQRRVSASHREHDGEEVASRGTTCEAILRKYNEAAAQKLVGSPISLLTLLGAVGSRTAAVAAASIGGAADSARSKRRHDRKRGMTRVRNGDWE
jgi:hypothetical protein